MNITCYYVRQEYPIFIIYVISLYVSTTDLYEDIAAEYINYPHFYCTWSMTKNTVGQHFLPYRMYYCTQIYNIYTEFLTFGRDTAWMCSDWLIMTATPPRRRWTMIIFIRFYDFCSMSQYVSKWQGSTEDGRNQKRMGWSDKFSRIAAW